MFLMFIEECLHCCCICILSKGSDMSSWTNIFCEDNEQSAKKVGNNSRIAEGSLFLFILVLTM